MGSGKFLEFSFVIFLLGFVFGSCNAYKFYVGGRNGWVLNPSQNYTQWAHINRFQVNDTLFFKYKKGSDSVLLVNKEDFNSCNTKNPIQSLTDGDSIFTVDHSGPFYFISGNSDNCNKGQKLHIIVMAKRLKPSPVPTDPQSPSPLALSSPVTSPVPPSPPTTAELAPPHHSGSDKSTYTGLLMLLTCVSIGVSVIIGGV
ncbi:early nodulin-like protein 3 [Mercurialis annua]|uniref:early nodulin-like protein 3 n=1 Tax=Mercurialis annua TaxID=3986 RepID=UPI00215E1470|nr:early nodulin-like protein 3 [Mercurialis annua]